LRLTRLRSDLQKILSTKKSLETKIKKAESKQSILEIDELTKLKRELNSIVELYKTFSKNVSNEFKKDISKRATHCSVSIAYLVAEAFIPKPTHYPADTKLVLLHIDLNSTNNKITNMRWVTELERHRYHIEHNEKVKDRIQEMKDAKIGHSMAKLSVTKVMLIKRLLKEGKTVNFLAKTFKVHTMQIYRIKWGENWADVPAAE
jgi:hypothetical protein